jgi:hypothetical protein
MYSQAKKLTILWLALYSNSFNDHGRFCGRGSTRFLALFLVILSRIMKPWPSRGHLALLATGAAVAVGVRTAGKVRGTIFSGFSLLHSDVS